MTHHSSPITHHALSRNARRLPAQHGRLAVGAPAVAADQPGFAYHSMTGNEPRDRIGADGAADGARGAGRADARGNLPVARERTEGHLEQGAPDFDLEVAALDEQR